jgi:hypothetical protein
MLTQVESVSSSSPLLSLPVDGLVELFKYLSPVDFGALWLCGSKSLNWSLSEGAVVCKVEITIEDKLVAWPSMLGNFTKLHTLILHVSECDECEPITTENLLSLPPTLVSLDLQWIGGLESMSDSLVAQPDRFAQLKELKIYEQSLGEPWDSEKVAVLFAINRRVQFGSNIPRGCNSYIFASFPNLAMLLGYRRRKLQ